jgi:hypothetical protein
VWKTGTFAHQLINKMNRSVNVLLMTDLALIYLVVYVTLHNLLNVYVFPDIQRSLTIQILIFKFFILSNVLYMK